MSSDHPVPDRLHRPRHRALVLRETRAFHDLLRESAGFRAPRSGPHVQYRSRTRAVLDVWFASCNLKFSGFVEEAMKRTSFARDKCPVARSVEAVGDWWSLLIVRDSFAGKSVQRVPEVAGGREEHPHSAAQEAGRRRGAGTRPGVGRQRVPGVRADREGARVVPRHRGTGSVGLRGTEFKLVDRKKGKPVRLELRSEDGRQLDSDEVRLVPVTEA